MWFIFALLSAVFAALTSVLAKIGIEGVNLILQLHLGPLLYLLWHGEWFS